MPRRNQPYLPLFVMDFLTDEKLRECSAASVGVYIMLMCVMHKQEVYGTISLRPKDRQSEDILQDFATKLGKHLPFDNTTIAEALRELISEGVLHMEEETLVQKRMVRDADISEKRAVAGKKGSSATNSKFAATKGAAKEAAKDGPPADEGQKPKKRGRPKKPEEPKKPYAEFVTMTESEYGRLVEKYGEAKTKRAIEILDNYKGSNGKKYASDYRTILNWVMERVEEEIAKRGGSGYGAYTDRGRDRRSTGDPGGFKPSGGFRGEDK